MAEADTIKRMGGWATWRELRAQHSRRSIDAAVAAGSIVRVSRDRYTCASTVEALQEAVRVGGQLSHLSAALHHGWKVKTVPDETWVSVPRRRGNLRKDTTGLRIHHADLARTQPRATVTDPLRTVLDCARILPFDEALTVADSALRSDDVDHSALVAAAREARGPGSVQVKRVAKHASSQAANPLESVLRALTIEVGLVMTPQFLVADAGIFATADLGSESLRLVIEAEGYETHGTRKGLRRDCVRHTEYAVYGWTSLRYAYEDVMFEQEWVRWSLESWLALNQGTAPPKRPPHVLGRAA